MAAGSKRHKGPNPDTPISDVEVSRLGRLLNYRESLNLKIEKFPEPITVIAPRPTKLVEIAEPLPLPSGYLPSARDLDYNIPEEKREFDLEPPLKQDLSLEKRDFVIQFLKDAKPETLEKFFNLAVEEAGAVPAGLFAPMADPASPSPPPAARPADAPPLWAQRGDDCEVSVIEWVKKYHGHLVGDFDEERGRQNRDALAKADPELARAYSSTVRSNKRNLLPGLPLLPRHATADPAEALKRRQETNREAAARYREKKRLSMMR